MEQIDFRIHRNSKQPTKVGEMLVRSNPWHPKVRAITVYSLSGLEGQRDGFSAREKGRFAARITWSIFLRGASR